MDTGYLDIVLDPLRSLRILRCDRCVNSILEKKKIQLTLSLLLVILFISFSLVAQTIKPENPIQFKIKNAGITVDGTISDWMVEVDFDPKKLAQSSIQGTANPVSIETGIKLRDRHLQGREYFDVKKYPEIRLQSKSFKTNGKNTFIGIFELQIRAVKKEVEIPFSVANSEKQRKFKGEFVIDRLDFGLGEKSLVLSDEVRVYLEF
ncbi:MAG: YceI family protein [Mongoliibacter sp.]|nr:MAG: YceI family protein [Mongoliibacter sp.]